MQETELQRNTHNVQHINIINTLEKIQKLEDCKREIDTDLVQDQICKYFL